MKGERVLSELNAKGFADARLDTWKSIAQYLGRSSRTVQRWRSEYGLPVRHLGGGATSVFAYTDELDSWLRERDQEFSGPAAIAGSAALASGKGGSEPDADESSNALAPYVVAGSSERRASELVGLAQKMWETLSESNLSRIAEKYREAVDMDPFNASAFAGLSHTLIGEGVFGRIHPSDAYFTAEAALRRALDLNPELAEAKCAAAWLKMLVGRDWEGAQISFDRLLNQQPTNTQALVGRALLSIAEGCFADASNLLREASFRRPLSTTATSLLCWTEYLAGRFESALVLVAQARDNGYTGGMLNTVEALAGVMLAGPMACIQRLEVLIAESPRHYGLQGVFGYACGITGQYQRARQVIDSMTVSGIRGTCDYGYSIAITFLGLNETEAAMEWLEKSYIYGSLWSLGFRWDPILTTLRNDPGAKELWGKMIYPVPGMGIPTLPTTG
jgi:tetratricopeptide (TPR) repeat protein